MKNNLISLFTGAGGLDWGFHNSNNYNLIASNEILKTHLQTYSEHYNIPLIKLSEYENETNISICGDVHDLTINSDTDILIGGPPCQDFSLLRGDNKRAGVTVKRGKLYQQYLRIIKSTKPKIFVFENVPGMASANKGLAYKTIQEDFIKEGYDLIFNQVIDLSHIGVPQSRKRLIIIGVKEECIDDIIQIKKIVNNYLSNSLLEKYPLTPLETFEGNTLNSLQEEYETIIKQYENVTNNIDNKIAKQWVDEYNNLTFDITNDYCKINNINNFNLDEFNNAMKEHEMILKILNYYLKPVEEQSYLDNSNSLPRRNKNIIERMHHIPPYYNFKTVENTQWKVKGLMSNIYRRIHPLKPSPTIIAYGGGGTGGYHYSYDRQGLTNRERARIQTFSDDYLFNGKSTEMRAQIGEAVPPLASYWIEKAVHEIEKNLI